MVIKLSWRKVDRSRMIGDDKIQEGKYKVFLDCQCTTLINIFEVFSDQKSAYLFSANEKPISHFSALVLNFYD